MWRTPETSKGVGQTSGLIGTGVRRTNLFLASGMRFAPGVNHFKVGIPSGRTTGLNQHMEAIRVHSILWSRASGMWFRQPEVSDFRPETENHTGD